MEDVDPRSLTPETDSSVRSPRIYVASLADYNAGRLHGRWIEAARPAEDLERQVTDMLDESNEMWAEEFEIHDYDGFGPLFIPPEESLEVVSRLAHGIVAHGEAFAHWAALVGTSDPEELARFDEAFLGTWDSSRAFAEQLVDDLGAQDALDDGHLPLAGYVRIDIDALARDLAIESFMSEGTSGVHVFRP